MLIWTLWVLVYLIHSLEDAVNLYQILPDINFKLLHVINIEITLLTDCKLFTIDTIDILIMDLK